MYSKTGHNELIASFLDFFDVLHMMQKRTANTSARNMSLCGAHIEFVVAMGNRGKGMHLTFG